MNIERISKDFKDKLAKDVSASVLRNLNTFALLSNDDNIRPILTIDAAMSLADAMITLMVSLEMSFNAPRDDKLSMLNTLIDSLPNRTTQIRARYKELRS